MSIALLKLRQSHHPIPQNRRTILIYFLLRLLTRTEAAYNSKIREQPGQETVGLMGPALTVLLGKGGGEGGTRYILGWRGAALPLQL